MERQRQIIANREKALDKIRQRQRQIKNTTTESTLTTKRPLATSAKTDSTSTITNSNKNNNLNKKPRLELTPEQKALIEKNRQKALERRRLREGLTNGNLRDASSNVTGNTTERNSAQSSSVDGVRVAPTKMADTHTQNKTLNPMFKMSDYIEYDFSKMTDTYGGFLADNNVGPNGEPQGKSLEEWKDEQKNKLMDQAPPLDLANAPRCFECNSIELDLKLLQAFDCRVCKKCREEKPEKYSLLTKTECKSDYYLTEPELKDEELFKRIVKANPHSGTFSRMQLFIRYQIEEYAFRKWGSADNLDKEWLRREEMRVERKESKFNKRLGEMRKKLRAEEITRKLRGEKGKKHIHDWNEPIRVNGGEKNLFKRRCKDCGVEVEEIKF